MMDDDPIQMTATEDVPDAQPAETLSVRGLGLRQHFTGWSHAPRVALVLGSSLFFIPGFLTFFFVAGFVQAVVQHQGVPTVALTGLLALMYLAFLTIPAALVLVSGLFDLRARPRLVGGRVVAVRHLRRRWSQAHYVQIELPGGKCERFRVGPEMHNAACQLGAQVALSVSPALRYVSRIWNEAADPPVLV
jgi:hypothetical protein